MSNKINTYKIKLLTLLLIGALCVLAVCSCGDSAADGKMPTVLNPNEYVLYTNIFYNEQAGDYVNKSTTKKGTFAVLDDQYSEVTRYYVWGYNDQTKCCDWQWEFVPSDTASLPTVGSLIEVKGIFVKTEDALDGYRIADASVTTVTEYKGDDLDVDMSTMSATLERVQLYNINVKKEYFNGKKVCAYGRIASPTSFQNPYYDNDWQMDFTTTGTVPATGTLVLIEGVASDGVITNATITPTSDY